MILFCTHALSDMARVHFKSTASEVFTTRRKSLDCRRPRHHPASKLTRPRGCCKLVNYVRLQSDLHPTQNSQHSPVTPNGGSEDEQQTRTLSPQTFKAHPSSTLHYSPQSLLPELNLSRLRIGSSFVLFSRPSIGGTRRSLLET
jgi:hypothetical protein